MLGYSSEWVLRTTSAGGGVSKDETEAARWYMKAAEQGHARAQWALGWMYERGDGVPKDEAEEARWYGKAVEKREI